jgi:hypothetical protein
VVVRDDKHWSCETAAMRIIVGLGCDRVNQRLYNFYLPLPVYAHRKDWLAMNQNTMSELSDMSNDGMLCVWAAIESNPRLVQRAVFSLYSGREQLNNI